MERTAVRASPVLFAATWYTTVPAPVPEAPLTIVSQLSLLVAFQAQAVDVFTLTLPVPPFASNDRLDSESKKVQTCPGEPVVVLDTETQGGADPSPIRRHGATST